MKSNWKPSEAALTTYAEYQSFWCHALRGLLQWDDEAIAEWLESHKRFHVREGFLDWCLHDTPAYAIAPLLVPASLLQRMLTHEPSAHVIVASRILDAIENGRGSAWYDEEPDPDWAACRQRVDAVLAEFEERFPEPETRGEA